jgi:hypothetical protein
VALGAFLEVLLIIAIGIVSLLSVLTLRQDFAGAAGDPGSAG